MNAAGITEETKQSGVSYQNKYFETLEAAKLREFGPDAYVLDNHYYADLQTVLQSGLSMTGYTSDNATNLTNIYVKSEDASAGFGKASKDSPSDDIDDLASTTLSGDIITVEKDGQLYWFKKDNAANFVQTTFTKTLEAGSTYSSSKYWNTEDFTLVDKSADNAAWTGAVFPHSSGLSNDQTTALVASGTKEYTAYVNKDKTNTVADKEVEAQAKAAVDADLDKSVKYESKTVTNTQPQYEYWVKITTKDSATTKDIDVVGSIWVGTSKSSAKKEKDGSEDKFRADFTLTNANKNDPGSYTDREDDVYIKPGERAVVSFADDASDEFTVEFGDDAYFVFNARGQGKLNLAYNTKYNKDFAYDYDDANIDFINFEGEPTTNRTGTLYIYADEDSYIYEVTSKGAKKINGAYYDDDEEAWVIRTRNLTSYAISDKKLKTVDQMNNGSSSSSGNNSGSTSGSGSNNGKPNPDTGR